MVFIIFHIGLDTETVIFYQNPCNNNTHLPTALALQILANSYCTLAKLIHEYSYIQLFLKL